MSSGPSLHTLNHPFGILFDYSDLLLAVLMNAERALGANAVESRQGWWTGRTKVKRKSLGGDAFAARNQISSGPLCFRLAPLLSLSALTTMVAPRDISDQPSAIDPLVLLPLPKHLPSPPTEDLQVLVSAFHDVLNGRSSIPISVLTSQLRLVTRNSHALLNASRSGTAEMRFELDNVDTELRGVEYELNRVREEIAKCEDYS